MTTYDTPGVYKEDIFPQPEFQLLTGVPAFLGFATSEKVQVNEPKPLTLWSQFEENFKPAPGGYLAATVHGFFSNGGTVCYVVLLDPAHPAMVALDHGLAALDPLEEIDLVCAPDIMRPPQKDAAIAEKDIQQMQRAVLNHCERHGNRLAILDALPGASSEQVRLQREGLSGQGISGANGALYYPWLWVLQPTAPLGKEKVPPCGHIAGVYARTDQQVGVHKAPANETLEEIVDLEVNLTAAQQDTLNPKGVNCVRAFPGRGIRIWGARTLSREPAWAYINVRRLFTTAGRWLERALAGVTFEPNNFVLWLRIERELRAYFGQLFRQGALSGVTEEEAFYVRCDADTNPPEIREAGMVITEIGLAPVVPNEFVVVQLVHGASGITISGPAQPR